ncbi:MAG TPA: DUF4386 domain-containing protein [Thermomicrobiales bacterium]|nr:DUF4386 domain-containing protein [Thermomicrobiales bacterium]
MENTMQATLPGRVGPASYRTTARAVGALFLAGMVVGIGGNGLIQSIVGAPDHLATVSANGRLLAIGALLMLLAGVWDAAHGILMLPVLKRHGERLAFGYLGYRIVDAVFIGLWVLFLLLQIPLGREYLSAGAAATSSLQALSAVAMQASLYAYQLAMLFVGLAGLLLCSVFYRARLVPRPVAVWGLAGYAIHLGGAVLELLGFKLGLLPVLPGGLWELFIGVWLIAKGFSPSPGPAERATPPTTPERATPAVGSATA